MIGYQAGSLPMRRLLVLSDSSAPLCLSKVEAQHGASQARRGLADASLSRITDPAPRCKLLKTSTGHKSRAELPAPLCMHPGKSHQS